MLIRVAGGGRLHIFSSLAVRIRGGDINVKSWKNGQNNIALASRLNRDAIQA